MVGSVVDFVSSWAIPVLITAILLHGHFKGVKLYESFVEGAGEGFWVAVKIIPYLVGIFVALGIFRESGAMDLVIGAIRPALNALGVPGEVVPLMIIRPLSGGGALGVTAELIRIHGPDSFVGRLASTMQGSTDTTFYILSLYFGSVGVKKIRHALAAGLIGDAAGFVASVAVTRWFFAG